MANSIENLKYQISESCLLKSSDTEVMARARVFYFEHLIEELVQKEDWDGVLKRTQIKNWKFTSLNGCATLAVNVWFRRVSALTAQLYKTEFPYEKIIAILDEADNFSQHLTTLKLHKKEVEELQKMIASQKLEVLTHLCHFYSFTQKPYNPFTAIELFEKIPYDQRVHGEHWYMIGRTALLLAEEMPERTAFPVFALSKSCFFFLHNLLASKPTLTPNEKILGGKCMEVLHFLNGTLGSWDEDSVPVGGGENFAQLIDELVFKEIAKTDPVIRSSPPQLDNRANTCFMNSALQVILNNPVILDSIDRLLPITAEPRAKRFLTILREMYAIEEIDLIALLKFHAACTEMGFVNNLGREEDAYELLFRITSLFPNLVNVSLELGGKVKTLDAMIKPFDPPMDPPEYLFIQLARFKEEIGEEQTTIVKNEDPIAIPKRLDLADLFKGSGKKTYEMVGRINHIGSLHSGHYTADILKGAQWFRTSDANIQVGQVFKWNDPTDRSAYVLIFKRST